MIRYVDLGPDWDIYGTVRHVVRIKYLVVICLPGVRLVLLRPGLGPIIESDHRVDLNVLPGEESLISSVDV